MRDLTRHPQLVVELLEPLRIGDGLGQQFERDRTIDRDFNGGVRMTRGLIAGCCALALVTTTGAMLTAQGGGRRPGSPPGDASVQIGGKWIDITYGRPLKRGRNVFPPGADYAKITHTDGAAVWRAGANVSTRLKTEGPIVINGKTVPAGEHSLFIDVKSPSDWTLIVSGYGAQQHYDPNSTDKNALWGSFGYTPDKDVARAPMKVETLPFSVEELTWSFVDVTNDGGRIAIMWDKTMASVPFKTGM